MFRHFSETLHAYLKDIDWGTDSDGEKREVPVEEGSASSDDLPSLTHRLTTPRIVEQYSHAPLFLRAEVSFDSVDGVNWPDDLDRIHRALESRYTVQSFDISHEINDDGKLVYGLTVAIQATR